MYIYISTLYIQHVHTRASLFHSALLSGGCPWLAFFVCLVLNPCRINPMKVTYISMMQDRCSPSIVHLSLSVSVCARNPRHTRACIRLGLDPPSSCSRFHARLPSSRTHCFFHTSAIGLFGPFYPIRCLKASLSDPLRSQFPSSIFFSRRLLMPLSPTRSLFLSLTSIPSLQPPSLTSILSLHSHPALTCASTTVIICGQQQKSVASTPLPLSTTQCRPTAQPCCFILLLMPQTAPSSASASARLRWTAASSDLIHSSSLPQAHSYPSRPRAHCAGILRPLQPPCCMRSGWRISRRRTCAPTCTCAMGMQALRCAATA